MESAAADENGVRHLLLCRVILGKMEVVPPGSEQWHPSSEEFDSGVDDSVSPRKYIMWSTNMNTHILPQYVVSFRVPSVKGEQLGRLIFRYLRGNCYKVFANVLYLFGCQGFKEIQFL